MCFLELSLEVTESLGEKNRIILIYCWYLLKLKETRYRKIWGQSNPGSMYSSYCTKSVAEISISKNRKKIRYNVGENEEHG